jgi:hypothetical protein
LTNTIAGAILNGLKRGFEMTQEIAVIIAVIHTLSIKHGIAVSEAAEAASILAAEVRLLRDEVNGLTGSLDRAEKAG